MPSLGGAVGGVTLPLDAGDINAKLEDPIVEALLDLSAWYIKWAIDAKISRFTGTESDAVPADRRYSFDPLEPRGIQIKLNPPCLFVYWRGESKWTNQTQLYATRSREIHMLYVFQELPAKAEMNLRSGLFNAVDAAMFQMCKRQAIAGYSYGDDPLGTWINKTLADLNTIEWDWMGGKPGRFGIDEGPLAERRAAKRSGRDYPALMGKWMVDERVALATLEDPTDVTPDIAFELKASDGETTETVVVINGILPAPDGSEELD